MKAILKSFLLSRGIEVRRISRPGAPQRPIASVRCFLEDIKARGFSPRGIIDVGANRGDWTRLALSVFPDTPTIMIEPVDELEAKLSQLVTEMPTCRYVKAAVGREESELVLTVYEDLIGPTFLADPDYEQLESGRQRKTKVTTIDILMRGLDVDFHPDLVKLDIQGFELEALSGAQTIFDKTEVFILETSLFQFYSSTPITRNVISFMADRGYELYDITEYLRRPHDGALGQLDLAFVKSQGIFRSESVW
jgi:FkbM family methyltransferase